eukprot:scpid100240/ scgid30664/ 
MHTHTYTWARMHIHACAKDIVRPLRGSTAHFGRSPLIAAAPGLLVTSNGGGDVWRTCPAPTPVTPCCVRNGAEGSGGGLLTAALVAVTEPDEDGLLIIHGCIRC